MKNTQPSFLLLVVKLFFLAIGRIYVEVIFLLVFTFLIVRALVTGLWFNIDDGWRLGRQAYFATIKKEMTKRYLAKQKHNQRNIK